MSTDERSQHQLGRLVERAVADVCGLPRPGLWFCVGRVVRGHPPERLTAWATLHFLPQDAPFCCGEPGCHLGLNEACIAEEVNEQIRRAMRLRHGVAVDFHNHIGVHYHPGVIFHRG